MPKAEAYGSSASSVGDYWVARLKRAMTPVENRRFLSTLFRARRPRHGRGTVAVVGGSDRAYVVAMADVVSPSGALASRPLLIAAAAGCGVVLAATAALWAHYGTTVFFETIASGFAACL